MRRHLRGTRAILLALGAALLGVAVHVARDVGVATHEALPLTDCPVAVVYVSASEIRMFRAGCTSSAVLRIPPGWRIQRLLGRVRDRGGWVCVIARDGVPRLEQQVVLFTGEKTRVLFTAQGVDDAWDVLQASLWKDRVVIPFVERGQLSIAVYDMCGRKLARNMLRLPGTRLKDEVGQVQMSDAGLAVSSIRAVGHEERQVYLFGKTGRPIRCLGEGALPVITRDGQQVAWVSHSRGPYVVMLHDVQHNRTTQVTAWRPRRFRDAYPFLGGAHASSICTVQWSPDGRWLVCALSRGLSISGLLLTAIDTQSPQRRRCYLPTVVERGRWVTDGHASEAR